jgi:hypothetical protein
MEAPKQSHFMSQVMINEVREFPCYVTIDKPVPRKACFDDRIFFKNTDTKRYSSDSNKSSDKAVENIREERNFIMDGFEFPVE